MASISTGDRKPSGEIRPPAAGRFPGHVRGSVRHALPECVRRLDLALTWSNATPAPTSPSDCSAPRSTGHPGRPLLRPPAQALGRGRRSLGPAIAAGIRDLGYQSSSTLLARYITQGRVEAGRPHLSPRGAACLLLTRSGGLVAARSETTVLASLITCFAALLTPNPGNDGVLCRLVRSLIIALTSADLGREVALGLLRLPRLSPSRRVSCTNP